MEKSDKNSLLKKVLETIKPMIIPWLLCLFIMGSIVYLLQTTKYTAYYFITAFYCGATMIFCRLVLTKKGKGIIATVIYLVVKYAVAIPTLFIVIQKSQSDIMLFVIVTVLSGFVAFTVYYFSTVKFRFFILFLVSLIPCAFYVTSNVPMSVFLCTPIIILVIALLIIQNRRQKGESTTFVNKKSYVISYIDFIVASMLLCMLVPKPETTYNSNFLDALNIDNIMMPQGSEMTEIKDDKYSSGAGYYASQSTLDKLIMTVSTDEPFYLKNKVYDIYIPEINKWTKSDIYNKGYNIKNIAKLNVNRKYYDILFKEMKYSDNDFGFTDIDYDTDAVAKAYIQSKNFSSCNIPYGGEADYIKYTNYEDPKKYLCVNSEIFAQNSAFPNQLAYFEQFFPYSTIGHTLPYQDILYNYFCINDDMLTEKQITQREQIKSNLRAYYSEDVFKNNMNVPASDDIKAVADTVTMGCDNSYQKAVALLNFFSYSGEYKYDIKFIPPDDNNTVEYFVLTSKKGTCSDFATAFAVMANYCGITTRYVEGFTMEKDLNSASTYNVYVRNSHAYCECYFDGYGWMVFDPTPSADNDGQLNFDFGKLNYTLILIVCSSVLGIIVLAFLCYILKDSFLEMLFRIKLKKANNENAVSKIYERTLYHTEKYYKNNAVAFTPQTLAEFIMGKKCVDISMLTDCFSKSYFGGINLTNEEKNMSYASYELLYKAFKKRGNKNVSTYHRGK